MSLIRIEDFPPERGFLLSVLRAGFRGVAPPMPSPSISWEIVLGEAAYHGVMPRFYRALDALAVPSEIRDSLQIGRAHV